MEFLIGLHSGLRWLLLLGLILATINAFSKSRYESIYSPKDRLLNLLVLILTHVQAVIGFILYFGNKRYTGFSQMDIPVSRFLAIEHLLGMFVAIILITVAYKKTKSGISDQLKHKKVWIYFFLSLLIILISIPWPFRGAGFDYFGYY